MSRIKGHYTIGGCRRDRWLDTTTGELFISETGGVAVTNAFKQQAPGVWTVQNYTFVPDVVPGNWYVIMLPASGYVRGPFPESHARRVASQRADAYSGTYAVVQLLPGNTVQHAPPAPPVINVVWS